MKKNLLLSTLIFVSAVHAHNDCVDIINLEQIIEDVVLQKNFATNVRSARAKKKDRQRKIILTAICLSAAAGGGLLLTNYNKTVRDCVEKIPVLNLLIWNHSKTEKNKNNQSNSKSNAKNNGSSQSKNGLQQTPPTPVNYTNELRDGQIELQRLEQVYQHNKSEENKKALNTASQRLRGNATKALKVAKTINQNTFDTVKAECDRIKKLCEQ